MTIWARKPTYFVCSECRVHYEPDWPWPTGADAALSHLCPTHRKPHIERAARKRVVMEWIERHWEEYEEAAKKEAADRNAAMESALQAASLRQRSPYEL